MAVVSQPKKIPKAFIFGTIGVMIPAIIIAIAFFAINSDAKNKAEYDRLRAEQAQRIADKAKADAALENQQAVSTAQVAE